MLGRGGARSFWERALPAIVRGPVLACAFLLLARICFSVAISLRRYSNSAQRLVQQSRTPGDLSPAPAASSCALMTRRETLAWGRRVRSLSVGRDQAALGSRTGRKTKARPPIKSNIYSSGWTGGATDAVLGADGCAAAAACGTA